MRRLTLAGCNRAAVERPAVLYAFGHRILVWSLRSIALHVADVAGELAAAGAEPDRPAAWTGHAAELLEAAELVDEAASAYRDRERELGEELLERAVERVALLGRVCVIHGLLRASDPASRRS